MAGRKKFVGCTVKRLPEDVRVEAAKTAVGENPANMPRLDVLPKSFLEVVDHPQAIAALTTKYWGTGGVRLGVFFMDNTVKELRDRIIENMNEWGKWANVAFAYSTSRDDVRLSRGPGGYYSYLGTDIRHIPQDEQTMNLEGFVLKTQESEYHRVVRHETGHTLGFPHEHMRRDLVALLDEQKTIAYFMKTQGWSAEEVRQQVLTPIEEASLLRPTPVDASSIMTYFLPGSITKSGQPIPGGTDIDSTDGAYAAGIYPKEVTTPPVTSAGGRGRVVVNFDIKDGEVVNPTVVLG